MTATLPAPDRPGVTREPLLSARGVVKRFGGLTAVGGVDLHVDAGQIVGLIGPNGSGKSTLLNCLSRDIELDEGTVELDGRDVTRLRASRLARRGLGRTFQNTRVFPELTVTENALLARDWNGVGPLGMLRGPDAATRQRVDDLLRTTEMVRLGRTLAGSLSGGQKRLLELVMALVARPRVVFLDEAASGVNPTLVEKLKQHVLAIREQEQVAFLVVEHNVDFIFSLSDRLVVMETGTVLAEGTPDQIRDNQEVIDAYLGA